MTTPSVMSDGENTGGVIEAMRARFARADEERMRLLDEAIKAGRDCPIPLGTLPGERGSAEEKIMPRGKRETAWECCGSWSHRHKAGCSQAGNGAKPVEVPVKRRVEQSAPRRGLALQAALDALPAWPVAELVLLKAAIGTEIERREQLAIDALNEIRKAMGSPEVNP